MGTALVVLLLIIVGGFALRAYQVRKREADIKFERESLDNSLTGVETMAARRRNENRPPLSTVKTAPDVSKGKSRDNRKTGLGDSVGTGDAHANLFNAATFTEITRDRETYDPPTAAPATNDDDDSRKRGGGGAFDGGGSSGDWERPTSSSSYESSSSSYSGSSSSDSSSSSSDSGSSSSSSSSSD